MIVSSKDFVTEIQRMVRSKHSKNHPIIGMIEEGKLDREQLKGFVGQFYLFFPKPFPKPIAAMLSRCPDDPEMEKMWIENVVEEGTGEITGTDTTSTGFGCLTGFGAGFTDFGAAARCGFTADSTTRAAARGSRRRGRGPRRWATRASLRPRRPGGRTPGPSR